MKIFILPGLTTVLIALFVDQVTKFFVMDNASSFARVSFGMFGGMPWWGLSALALLICAVLGVLLFRSDNRIEAVALGAIIGGALGNVVDRFRFQAVTDFLSFHIAGLYWPAFNLADVFVVCGVGVLLLYPVWDARRQA